MIGESWYYFKACAGETRRERFRIGSDGGASPMLLKYPRAIERQGQTSGGCCDRTRCMLYGLRASEAEGVNFTGPQVRLIHVILDITK